MLGVECRFSNFLARANLLVEVDAGSTYQLRITVDYEEAADGRRYCDFWVVDQATGKSVTQVYRRQFTGGKSGSSFRTSN